MLDLKVRFVLCWCNHTIWLVCLRVRVFYHYSHGLPENRSAPTAHFPSAELWSGVLFCLTESFRIKLFPKTPSQTQKSAIIVACRLSSVRTHGVPYGMWATHQNDWKCWVFVWFTHLWLGLCIYNLSTPCGFQSDYIIPEEPLLSNLSLSTDVQPIRSELSPSPPAQAEPEKSAAVVILQGSAGHWRFAWAAACRLPGV